MMARRFVDQLSDGELVDEVYLLTDKQLRANRNGNLFIQLELRDRSGVITGRLWNAGEPLFRSIENGDFLSIRGKVQLFQGTLQIILSGLEKVDGNQIELPDYLPHTDQDVGKLLDRLRSSLRKVGNHHLKALGECYMMDDAFLNGFCKAPAGIRVHHAYIGGLLEHVVTMLDIGERLSPLYPDIDKDLLQMGIFLHDTGKVRELSYNRAFGYSNEGQLLGHLSIGVEMLDEMVRKVPDLTGEPFPRELLMRLKHMILSHHGTLAFGSPKVPMTPEAVALHAIDHLDTRIHITLREINDDRNNPSAWTPFNSALDRKLYKGSMVNEGTDFPGSLDDTI